MEDLERPKRNAKKHNRKASINALLIPCVIH